MKIFFAPDTRAVRVVWLFEELGLPYELELFKLGDASMRSSAYLGIHPLGRVPTLVDDKVTIFESGAIVQYVLAKYGSGRLTLIVSASGRRSKRRVQRESRGAQTSPRKPNRFVAAAKRRSLRR